MNTRAIDYITEDFYESLCFQESELPDLDTAASLFYNDGILINNSFARPITFTASSFVQNLQAQIADGTLTQFMQRELHAKTDIFGKIAQRISIYEYSLADHETEKLPRGINYIQFILTDDTWRVTSMVWSDENENHQIPERYLS